MIDFLLSASFDGLHFVFRWLHLFWGIVWIGLLYYFNFVQGSFMNETDAPAKSQVTQKLVPRAMWWFRYGALWTFVTGFVMISIRMHQEATAGGVNVATSYWLNILTGALMATLMFLNVWGIIWRAQKVIIANAVNVAAGKPADPKAAAVGPRSTCASRTNVLFSIPMMFFMVGANHLGFPVTETSNVAAYWICALILIGVIEANAIFGKTGPITTVKGVISWGFVLTAVFVALNAIFI
jgi:uncharacterized membrane protein